MSVSLLLVLLVGCDGPGTASDTVYASHQPMPAAPPDHLVSGDRGEGSLPTGGGTTTPGTGTTQPAPITDQACFPGVLEDFSTCLDLVALNPAPAEYAYPAPMNGSPQYTEPVQYLDLAVESPATMVAPNFRLDELAEEWKGRYAVVQPHAVERLQDMRDQLGALVVNSGYRNPDYNAGVGGATWSRHMYGDAFDIDPVAVSLDTLADTCYAHGASYVGVYVSHIHCDWRDDPLDPFFYGLFGSPMMAHVITPTPAHAAEIVDRGTFLEAPAEGWDEGEPLRRWSAWDANGVMLAWEEAETFTPPPGTDRVTVNIGLELEVEIDL